MIDLLLTYSLLGVASFIWASLRDPELSKKLECVFETVGFILLWPLYWTTKE